MTHRRLRTLSGRAEPRGDRLSLRDNLVMRPRTRPRVRAIGIAVAALLAVPLAGCAALFFTDGDELAHRGAENIAAQIGSHTDNSRSAPILTTPER